MEEGAGCREAMGHAVSQRRRCSLDARLPVKPVRGPDLLIGLQRQVNQWK